MAWQEVLNELVALFTAYRDARSSTGHLLSGLPFGYTTSSDVVEAGRAEEKALADLIAFIKK